MKLIFKKVQPDDVNRLTEYFLHLSEKSRSRFGPHPFDRKTVEMICRQDYKDFIGFVCQYKTQIIGYIVVKRGYIKGDLERFTNYQVQCNSKTDFTMAPSVADKYQLKGIGSQLFKFVEMELKLAKVKKIVLWGGVQHTNQQAINFYYKHGFEVLGEFRHNNLDNLDMIKIL